MTAKLGTKLNDQRLMEKVRSILQDEAYREGSDQQLGELLISYLKGEIRIQKALSALENDFPGHND